MKKRFTEEHIIQVLKEHAAGAKVAELCRKHGISDPTLYKWKAALGTSLPLPHPDTINQVWRRRVLQQPFRRFVC